MHSYNPQRGDVKLSMQGDEIVLRPSFYAITLVEEHFKRGIIDIARDYHNGKVTHAADFLALLQAGMKGAGAEAPADLPDRMIAAGLSHLIEPCGKFLAHACGLRG